MFSRLWGFPATLWGLCLLAASPAQGQTGTRAPAPSVFLRDLSTAVESLTRHVSASVVQVLVTGYGNVEGRPGGGAVGPVIARQRTMGSGAIIDSDGYIITNVHVVAGAQRVQVVLHRDTTADDPVQSLTADAGKLFDARIVGVATDIDLALLKIEIGGLRALRLADYTRIRQGELVFAFGSPEGLRNSVTMGVVSSVARQPDPDSPLVYIQTDAPINPGNSGGPLVNVDGELVGVNAFILSESGGSQGLGFAIPSAVVAFAFPQLRKYGHLHRGVIGISLQAITPALAAGLDLPVAAGVLVSDVMPDSPAETSGVSIRDIITSVNGRPVESVPMLALELSQFAAGDTFSLGLRRGTETLSRTVTATEQPHPIDEVVGLADPETNSVPKLGILGVDVGNATAPLLPELRIPFGVFVAARTPGSLVNEVPLAAGDVIHSVNNISVRSVDGLRALVDDLKAHSELVLQIERGGRLLFVTCEIYSGEL